MTLMTHVMIRYIKYKCHKCHFIDKVNTLIDSHCHTKITKSGEDVRINISPYDFRNAILNAQIKMVVITNHNEFYKQEFIKYKNYANNEFIVLPGIELDVEGLESARGHIVIVYDDRDIDYFKLLINGYL